MRIGIFTDTYNPDVNGVARSAELLHDKFTELGHEVFVICTHPGLSIKEEGNIIRLPGLEMKKFYGYAIAQPIHPLFTKKIKNLNLDIIHAETEFGVGIIANIIASNLKIPLVRTYHTDYVDYMKYFNVTGNKLVSKGLENAAGKFSKIYGNNCLRLMTPSEKTALMLKEVGIQTKINIIPNGIDLSSFKPILNDPNVDRLKKELNIKDEKVLVYVGRTAKEKSFDMILDVFLKVKKNNLKVKLVVVGIGPQLEEYKKFVLNNKLEDYVTFVGKKPFEEVPHYYHLGDGFISASTSETQGLTYIEALSSGLPILVHKDDVLDGILIKNTNGFEFNSEEELYDTIVKFINLDKDKLRAMSKSAIDSVSKYDSMVFAKNTIKIYKEVIEEYKTSYLVEHIRLKNDTVSIYLANSLKQVDKIVLSVEDFYDNGIRANTLIHENMLVYLKQRETYAKAYKSCMKKLAIKDYSRSQLYNHMKEKFELDDELANKILDKLESMHLINDEEYAISFIKKLNSKMLSYKVINKRIKEIGVTKDIIKDAFSKVDIDDLNNCKQKANKYYYTVRNKSSAMKKKTIVSKLVADGFSYENANVAVGELDFSNDVINDNKLIKIEALKAYNRYVKKYEGSELRNKIFAYLLGKGFEYEYIYIAINELEGID